MKGRFTPEPLQDSTVGVVAAAAIGDIDDVRDGRKLARQYPPEIDDRHLAARRCEVGDGQGPKLRIRRGDDDDVGLAKAIADRIENERAPAELKVGSGAGERIVAEHARAGVEEGLRQRDRRRFLDHVRERFVGQARQRSHHG